MPVTRLRKSESPSLQAATSSTAPALLEVRDLCIDLHTRQGLTRLVDSVSFSVAPGEVLGVAGESGSGKTLTALSILRLLPPGRMQVSGHVTFAGADVLSLRREPLRRLRGSQIAMVFQEPMVSLHPSWTVGEQIAETVRTHLGVSRQAARERAVEVLDLVHIPDPARRARQHPHEMSGGMLQRVMIAMALSCRPKLLIADEPTTALDVTVQAQLIDLLRELHDELDMAMIVVSHDLSLLATFCERLMVMYGGQIVEDGSVREVFTAPRHPYTEALLSATIEPEQRGSDLATIPGSPPDPRALPPGCRFTPRCTYAVDECSARVPSLELLGSDRRVRCVRQADLELTGTRR
jgi:peptide/nickel transport system ATP-binding protein